MNWTWKNWPLFPQSAIAERLKTKIKRAFFAQSKEAFIKEEIGEENYMLIEQVKRLQQQKGVQAILPFRLNIK